MLAAVDDDQPAAPPGSEDALRAHCREVLGMNEIPEPPQLAAAAGS